MRRLLTVLLALVSFALCAEETVPLEFVGSFSSERFPGEHYYLTEAWLWKQHSEYVGVFFVYAGLGGDGPVRPMIVKIDKSTGGQGKDFSFNAGSFSFMGHFDSDRITGNLKNGSDNWDGGQDKTILASGTHVQTIANPGNTLHTYKEWIQWANALE
jgi:hypothetical protein